MSLAASVPRALLPSARGTLAAKRSVALPRLPPRGHTRFERGLFLVSRPLSLPAPRKVRGHLLGVLVLVGPNAGLHALDGQDVAVHPVAQAEGVIDELRAVDFRFG